MIVKHRLPILMASKGIRTVQELAKLAGYEDRNDRCFYRFYNNESKTFDPELIAAICKALDCRIDELLYIDGQAVS